MADEVSNITIIKILKKDPSLLRLKYLEEKRIKLHLTKHTARHSIAPTFSTIILSILR